jgi:hypothetical protein
LENNGDVWGVSADGLAVPKYFPGRWSREAGKHAKQRGFSGAGGAEQGDDFARNYFEIGGSNDLDTVPVRLNVELLDANCLDDRIRHW